MYESTSVKDSGEHTTHFAAVTVKIGLTEC